MTTLDKGLPIPLYHQLKTILLNKIEEGEWKPEEQLPTESELANQFNVSKITVRQALKEIADLGIVRREQGRGTFVEKPKVQQGPRALTGFTDEMRRHGLPAASKVLEKSIMEATPELAEALQVPVGSRLFVLKRLRLAEGEPMGIQTAHLPMELVPGLMDEPFENISLYALLQSKYGLRAANARETHFAVLVEPDQADLLGAPAGSPALAAERVTFLPGGRPLELVHSIMRGDRYKIVLDLVQEPLGNK